MTLMTKLEVVIVKDLNKKLYMKLVMGVETVSIKLSKVSRRCC